MKKLAMAKVILVSVYYFVLIKTLFSLCLFCFPLDIYSGIKYFVLSVVSVILYLTIWSNLTIKKDVSGLSKSQSVLKDE